MTGALLASVHLVASTSGDGFPPLSCEGRDDGAFWGLELLGDQAVRHTANTRETLNVSKKMTVQSPSKRTVYLIADGDFQVIAVATERGCLRNDLRFPVDLQVYFPDDPQRRPLAGCCTVAE